MSGILAGKRRHTDIEVEPSTFAGVLPGEDGQLVPITDRPGFPLWVRQGSVLVPAMDPGAWNPSTRVTPLTTSDDTPTTIASSDIVSEGSVLDLEIECCGTDGSGENFIASHQQVSFGRETGDDVAQLGAVTTIHERTNGIGLAVTFLADTTNQQVHVQVQGTDGTSTNWICSVKQTLIDGPL